MRIRENKNSLKNYISTNKFLIVIILASSLMLPIILVLNLIDILPMEIINAMSSLWIGFYSCIFLVFFAGEKIPVWVKFIIVTLNIIIILFLMFASLMGGFQDLSAIIIKMILPFIPMKWILNFIYSIFGEAMPYQ